MDSKKLQSTGTIGTYSTPFLLRFTMSLMLRKCLWAILSFVFLLLVICAFFYIYLESELPNIDSLNTVKLQVPLRIYSQDGLLIQEYGEKRRIPLTYEEIPQTLVHAVLATEDQRFFDHPGVDVFGLARATMRMIKTGTKSQGGSTITMQVARNFFLNRKKTFLRKFNEIMLAIKIDRQLSKEKILELYLNKIYLGNRAYGVGAAAQIYYGKTLKELSLAQLAMIAGLPQAPSTQNPIVNPHAAIKRRDHVLERLFEESYITRAQYTAAIHEPNTAYYHGTEIKVSAPYLAEMIRQSMVEHFGPSAYTRGFNVYTTIQSNLQIHANRIIENHLLSYEQRHGYRGPVAHTAIDLRNPSMQNQLAKVFAHYPTVSDLQPGVVLAVTDKTAQVAMKQQKITIPWEGLAWARPALKNGWVGRAPQHATQILSVGDVIYLRYQQHQWQLTQLPLAEGALLALNPKNGAVEALVGGFNFEKSKFNRVTQSARQPGSSFKPFIYAAALNKGYTLATLINDAPIVVDDPTQENGWRPRNDNLKFNGPTRLKDALVRSRNLVSIRILDDIGIDYAIDYASRFGFKKSSLPRTLSLALGSLSASPMELTRAYAVLANGGFKIEPYLIHHITDSDGHTLLQANPAIAADKQDGAQKPNLLAPRVVDSETAFLINSALLGVIQNGTAQAAKSLQRPDLAGKTGTTNEQVDAWFAGYTPNLVATVWIGYDTPHPLHEYAATLALPTWIEFMKIALKDIPVEDMPQPKNIVAVQINPTTGLLAKENQANNMVEFFRQQDVPSADDIAIESASNNPAVNNLQAADQESLF